MLSERATKGRSANRGRMCAAVAGCHIHTVPMDPLLQITSISFSLKDLNLSREIPALPKQGITSFSK